MDGAAADLPTYGARPFTVNEFVYTLAVAHDVVEVRLKAVVAEAPCAFAVFAGKHRGSSLHFDVLAEMTVFVMLPVARSLVTYSPPR